jgi:putative transposase
MKCLIYIDLNMVRTGVVAHPSQWPWSGYNEIQNPPERYALIDRSKLKDLLGIRDENKFLEYHRQWVDDALSQDSHKRESRWTESVAVGSREFVEQTKEHLGFRAKGRKVNGKEETFELRETGDVYHFGPENGDVNPENAYLWDDTF